MLNYKTASKMIDKFNHLPRRKLANNTYLRRLENGNLAVRFHETDIIIIRKDGTWKLNSGGYRTKTTLARINEFSPARLFTEKFVWYSGNNWKKENVFFDGVVIISCGKLAKKCVREQKRELKKMNFIKKSIDDYIKELRKLEKFPLPNSGDCWGCFMTTDTGDYAMGNSCIIGHIKEKYIMGSLNVRALRFTGQGDFGVRWVITRASEGNRYAKDDIVRALRKLFRHELMKGGV